MDNQYDSMTLANLRALAKELGLKNITSYKKNELIEAIRKISPEVKKDISNETETAGESKAGTATQQPISSREQAEDAQEAGREKLAQKPVKELSQDKRAQMADRQEAIKEKSAQTPELQKSTQEMKARTEGAAKAVRGRATQDEAAVAAMHDRKGLAEETHKAADEKKLQTEAAPDAGAQKQKEAQELAGEKRMQKSMRDIAADNKPAADTGHKAVSEKAAVKKAHTEALQEAATEKTQTESSHTAEREDRAQSEMSSAAAREEKKIGLLSSSEIEQLDSGETKEGILEVLPDGYGFIRCDNYLPGENDVYVSPAQIRRFNLKTGDIVTGNTKIRSQNEKFSALLYIKSVNGFPPAEAQKRKRFEDLTPIFPNKRIHLETPGGGVAMRMVDLISPIGKGQRGMIVSQPKTGKTTLLKQIAKAITANHPEMRMIILLIDERPEEVTDIKESIEGKNVEVIYSTFDELPENHKRVSEMVIERAKRLVEHKQDVIILLDSITRLARAYNLTVQPSGRTLSGGLDPAALHMPKKFFGAARNMREGGSLTILATALVDTGSRMDDVVFEEFKGTGNMELVLDRSLSEKRIFPAIDLPRSSTRREDLLLTQSELEATYLMRKALGGLKSEEALERIIELFLRTKTNAEFIEIIKKTKIVF